MIKTLFSIFLLFLVAQPLVVHSRILRSTTNTHSLQNLDQSIQNGDTSDIVITLARARKYLKALGYLEDNNKPNFSNTNTGDQKTNDDVVDEHLEASIKRFQEFYNLKVSGKLDSETINLMSMPRCGVPDFGAKVTSRFAFFKEKPQWPKKNLIYRLQSSVEILPQEVLRSVFKEAFNQWSSVSSFTFEEAPIGTDADIVIGFFSGDHGDGFPFNKFGLELAHAFAPPDGRLHVDADKPWSNNVPIERGYYDLVWVAMHEIGHILGLDHSSHHHAIMYAYVTQGVNRRRLNVDDIASIRSLYSLPSPGLSDVEYSPGVRLSYSVMLLYFWFIVCYYLLIL